MKVDFRSIEFKIYLQTTAGTGVEQAVRAMIVLDRQPNGAAPGAITDIIMSNHVYSPRNLANRKRFKILWDRSYAMGATAVATGNPTSRMIKGYLKFRRPIVTEFNTGVAGNISDISTNSLYFVTTGNMATGITDAGAIHYFRLRYTDM